MVANTTSVFVNHASSIIVPAKSSCQIQWQYGRLYPNVPLEKRDLFIGFFFSSFLANNDFSGSALDLSTITSQFQSSPSLYNACIAVGALGFGKKLPIGESAASTVGALKAYRTSISSFQKEIDTDGFLHYEACLWTTFFLGIFEVCTPYTKIIFYTDFHAVDVRCHRPRMDETYSFWYLPIARTTRP